MRKVLVGVACGILALLVLCLVPGVSAYAHRSLDTAYADFCELVFADTGGFDICR